MSAPSSSRPAPRSPHRLAQLRGRARRMRHSPTTSEQILWLYLRRKQLLGVQFRRQVVLGHRIVDFLASSVKLIVEVDGGYHSEQSRLDAARERRLRQAGYHVLRLSDELVQQQPQHAVALVRQALRQLLGQE